MGEVGWSVGSAKLGAARVAANLFAVQFDRDMQFPTARGACSDKANGSCHRFASLFARKSCLPKNPERGDVVAAAIKGADYCGVFFLCQYLNVVFIPCMPCEIAWLGWGNRGNQGERWMVGPAEGPAEGPKVSEGCRLIGGVGDWGWLLEWDFEESWTTWSWSASIAR